MKHRLLFLTLLAAAFVQALPAQVPYGFASQRRPIGPFELIFGAHLGRDDIVRLNRESGLYAGYEILNTPGRVAMHPRIQGPVRMLGGGLEAVGGGYYTYQTGGVGGWLGGGVLMANGADNFWAGWRMFSTGQYQQAFLEQGLTSTLGPGWGTGAYAVTQFGMIGAPFAGTRLNSLMRPAQLVPDLPISQTTILGENMFERVIPFAERTGARTIPFGTSAEAWDILSPYQRWKLNDGLLRARINEGDSFRFIGIDPGRRPYMRTKFDLTGSELLRLNDRGIFYETVSPEEIMSLIGRP